MRDKQMYVRKYMVLKTWNDTVDVSFQWMCPILCFYLSSIRLHLGTFFWHLLSLSGFFFLSGKAAFNEFKKSNISINSVFHRAYQYPLAVTYSQYSMDSHTLLLT